MRVVDVPAIDGVRWLKTAWKDFFAKSPIAWIGLMAAWMMIGLSSLILLNFLGLVIFVLLQPAFFGGLMLACHGQTLGETPRVLKLFSAFNRKIGPLLTVGGISMFLHMAGSLLLDVLGMPRLELAPDGKSVDIEAFQAALQGKEWLFLVWGAITGLIQGGLWFVPPLIVLHEMTAGHAIRWSVYAFLSNFGAALLCGIAILIMYIIALIPAGIGMFIALPLMTITNYVAYKAMFVDDVVATPDPRTGAAD